MNGEKVCSKCGGAGRILTRRGHEGETDTWGRCICSFAKMFRLRVGTEIASAQSTTNSPLYVPGPPGEPPEEDGTLSNLFIKGWWSDLTGHFKYVFTWKYLKLENYYLQIVTDEQLRTVYLGKEGYDRRSKKKRDEMTTYNSLRDLVGPDYNLVIIQLGFLGHKNMAMPGILKESLLIRQSLNLPTWIVESPESIFGPGHFSYSEDTADYILNRYDILDLTESRNREIRPRGVEGTEISDEDGMTVDRDSEPVVRMPEPRFRVDRDEVGPSSSYKSKRGYKKPSKTRDDIV